MRIRLVLALVTAVLSVLVGAPAHAARPAAVQAVTFNVCGNVCRHGEVGATAGNIAYQVRALGASVAMLQELCYSQFLGIRDRLARYGYRAEFARASTGGRCDDYDRKHGTGFGIAILARGTMAGKVLYKLPSPYGRHQEGRVVLGVTVRLPGRTLFAVTTHTALGPNLPIQLGALRRWLVPIASHRPVLFGGDLNVAPDSADLDAFYAAFREANAGRKNGLPTFLSRPNRKIDYLFGSRGFLAPAGVASANTGYSDHSVYLGAFR